ncbi:hypothetical protein, partial [Glaesserella parasuis]|uniref:hypothetical protein n=1 Tax=Glaesserella parasuis TaxID=738 RepID=UPI003B66FB53
HGGNVHLNALKFSDKLTPENQGISTLLHETMHALALKHPFAPCIRIWAKENPITSTFIMGL